MDKKRIQAAVGVAPADGLISPAYVVAQPFPGTVPGYFAYLYRTAAYMGEVNNYSRGIVADRNRLYWDEFKQIPTPYPPPPEQVAIVRFLDQAERRVRRYIRAKRKLIGLLNEMKQGIIHRTVTRGLDPNVRLKPSGVEWLGDVPEHWRSTRLKHLATIQTGITLGSLARTTARKSSWNDHTSEWRTSKPEGWTCRRSRRSVCHPRRPNRRSCEKVTS